MRDAEVNAVIFVQSHSINALASFESPSERLSPCRKPAKEKSASADQ